MTLLQICQDAADQIGLDVRPVQIIGNPDPDAQRLLRFAGMIGREMATRAPWQALQLQQQWSAQAAETQANAIPADFLRFVPESAFDLTNYAALIGPIDPAEYASRRAMWTGQTSGGTRWFTRAGNALNFWPIPSGGEQFRYTYQSNAFCTSAAGVPQNAWRADTDIPAIPQELFTLGIVWRFLMQEGQPYQEQKRDFETRFAMEYQNEQATPRVMSAGDIFGGAGRYSTGEPGERGAGGVGGSLPSWSTWGGTWNG